MVVYNGKALGQRRGAAAMGHEDAFPPLRPNADKASAPHQFAAASLRESAVAQQGMPDQGLECRAAVAQMTFEPARGSGAVVNN